MKVALLLPFVFFLVAMNTTIWNSGQETMGEMVKIVERPATMQATVTAERNSEISKARASRRFITYSFVVDGRDYSREVEDSSQLSKGQQLAITYCQGDPRLSVAGRPEEKIREIEKGRYFLLGCDILLGAILLLAARRLTRPE